MTDYDNLSICYDDFTTDVDYAARGKYLLSLFNRFGKKPKLMLDLACGTGNFSYIFKKMGIEVIGVDRSEGMLSAAIEKNHTGDNNPLFLNQSAENLDLFGTVDGAVCLLDSLNHITDESTLNKAISRVSLFLEKDCLFIFDLNTLYKHKTVLGNNCFMRENKESVCIWQSRYHKDGVVNITADIFTTFDKKNYKRFKESFSEKAYNHSCIEKLLLNNSLEIAAVYDDMSYNPPNEKSERIIYVARKV